MLNIEHLTKRYGDKTAVDDLTLRVAPGELCTLIGPGGAGKSAVLRAAAGVRPFDGGSIRIGGIDLRADPIACKRSFAYLPDVPDPYEFMTGAGYLNFIADVFAVSAADRQARVRRLADAFALSDALDQPVAAYPLEARQRLSLIAAWLHEPRLLLMDEPFALLDQKSAQTLRRMLRELCAQGGAVLLSARTLETAESLGGTVALLRDGKLLRLGAAEELRADPSLKKPLRELEEKA